MLPAGRVHIRLDVAALISGFLRGVEVVWVLAD